MFLRHSSRSSSFLSLASNVFFFHVQRKRRIARRIVEVLTLTPVCASQSLQCSSKVASGCASSCGLNLSCSIPVFLGGHPGISFCSRLPVSRRCFRYRLIDASTPQRA